MFVCRCLRPSRNVSFQRLPLNVRPTTFPTLSPLPFSISISTPLLYSRTDLSSTPRRTVSYSIPSSSSYSTPTSPVCRISLVCPSPNPSEAQSMLRFLTSEARHSRGSRTILCSLDRVTVGDRGTEEEDSREHSHQVSEDGKNHETAGLLSPMRVLGTFA